MKLHNSLTKQVEELKPKDNRLSIYSCGPTVYERVHIGNLRSFIFTDTLRRAIRLTSPNIQINHVMNVTDVDDKTIANSQKTHPELQPRDALEKLTSNFQAKFIKDIEAIGNDTASTKLLRATDPANIKSMQDLITELGTSGFAYYTNDGIYFSIEKYKASGGKYGQLIEVIDNDTAHHRIDNDEYDKLNAHDFVLWKAKKDNEPSWEFTFSGKKIDGRPGWHIECSAMSEQALGLPLDIHTGGVDLKFPHHENEIAQSTAGRDGEYSHFFVHHEHILIDGKKMSKSLGNFYTLSDIVNRGYDTLALRLLLNQAHYRTQINFTWGGLEAMQSILAKWQAWADLQFQNLDSSKLAEDYRDTKLAIFESLKNDLDMPEVYALINGIVKRTDELGVDSTTIREASKFLDALLGLSLSKREDISDVQKRLISERQAARKSKDWTKTDSLREELNKQGINLKDTEQGTVWSRAKL